MYGHTADAVYAYALSVLHSSHDAEGVVHDTFKIYSGAIMWACQTGVTQGYGNGLFKPDSVCSRAQVLTFIYRAEVENKA